MMCGTYPEEEQLSQTPVDPRSLGFEQNLHVNRPGLLGISEFLAGNEYTSLDVPYCLSLTAQSI